LNRKRSRRCWINWVRGTKRLRPVWFRCCIGELHKLAELRLWNEQKAASLRATELVNEAYLRLLAKRIGTVQNRSHFFATAAKAMRNILIDYIRSKQTEKRGGGLVRVGLGERHGNRSGTICRPAGAA
jgi:RNA polymerase sigma factor (TIGR02999 family)